MLTQNGERLIIQNPGQYNSNQGPDFSNARINLDSTTWAGTIELHLKTSDWNRHKHQHDPNYNNVILHVVWEDDMPINERSQEKTTTASLLNIPVLELGSRIPKILLHRYDDLMQSNSFIPCEKSIPLVKDIVWEGWKETLLATRLMRKAALVEELLYQNNFHWEETSWWMIARNFGMKVNAEAFEAIARSLPLNLLARHKGQVHQVEALLLGQAGLLEQAFTEKYPIMLQQEYRFLQTKYNLKPILMPIHLLRMRPGNFPAIRLAELAILIHQSTHLFSRIKEARSVTDIRSFFEITANDYWHYHYQLDELSGFKKKTIGDSMTDNIIINSVAPLLFAYGTYHKDNRFKEKALDCLEHVKPERNSITDGFKALQVENKNARDSQALIELRNEFCEKKRCLDCAIGNAILKHPES